jgi:hypothetical protein
MKPNTSTVTTALAGVSGACGSRHAEAISIGRLDRGVFGSRETVMPASYSLRIGRGNVIFRRSDNQIAVRPSTGMGQSMDAEIRTLGRRTRVAGGGDWEASRFWTCRRLRMTCRGGERSCKTRHP